MASFRLVIGTKEGKCIQKNVQPPNADLLLGKKIGDKVVGDELGFNGYEFVITGGSDNCGFPMRRDVTGVSRKKILSVAGTIGLSGWYKKKKYGKFVNKKIGSGVRLRKTVCGNTIHEKITQVNVKML